MNVGGLIEGSIRGYHLSNKRGLIPHPTTISKLCILARVRGSWDKEETCPKASTLTITGVTKGPKNKNQKGIVELEAGKLCILARVRGSWDKEETCPKASTLTLTGVTKGLKNKNQKGIVELEVQPNEENDNREMETVPEQIPLVEEENMPFKMIPLSHSGPESREDFPELAESSRKDAGNIEIMEMLRSIKKEMEEKE